MPPEVLRTVNSINAVITSLGEEKKAMLKALKAESTAAAQLRALNSDLSQKLEAQTQQLELAVAQRMAHGSRVSVQVAPKPGIVATDFVDEGDEVVDRVLGWIMHLFPGGSSRRNGVKRL
jgi:multidrug resistance efflux pump